MPRMAAFGKEIFGRVFTHMDVAGLPSLKL